MDNLTPRNQSNTPKSDKVKVIDSLWVFLMATAVAGPFALPLLWRNPRYSKVTKVAGSIAVILFTLFLIYLSKVGIVELNQYLMEVPTN